MPDRPNVLLITADHWFGRLIGALGHPTVLTPTLDQFIGNGVAYTNASTAKRCERNLPLNVYMICRRLFQSAT